AWQVLRRTDEILGRESRAAADWDAFTVIGELGVTVERLRRTLLDEKGQVALQSTTADAILNALPDPVLPLTSPPQVSPANFAARKFFGIVMLGHALDVVLRHPAVVEAAVSLLHGESGLASA